MLRNDAGIIGPGLCVDRDKSVFRCSGEFDGDPSCTKHGSDPAELVAELARRFRPAGRRLDPARRVCCEILQHGSLIIPEEGTPLNARVPLLRWLVHPLGPSRLSRRIAENPGR